MPITVSRNPASLIIRTGIVCRGREGFPAHLHWAPTSPPRDSPGGHRPLSSGFLFRWGSPDDVDVDGVDVMMKSGTLIRVENFVVMA
jgi:hypothetical protein